MKGISKPGK